MRTTHPEVPWPAPSTVMDPADASFFREMWPHRVRPKEAWSVHKGHANVWPKAAPARKLKPRSEASPRAHAPWRYTILPSDEAPYARRQWTSARERKQLSTCRNNEDADCGQSSYSPLRDANSSRVWGSSKSPVLVPYGNIAGVRSGLYRNPSPRVLSRWNGDDVYEMCGSPSRAFASPMPRTPLHAPCERRASVTPPLSALSAAGTTTQEHSEPHLRDRIRPQTAPPHRGRPAAGSQARTQDQPATTQGRELHAALDRVEELEEELSLTKQSVSIRVKALQEELSNSAWVIDNLQKELKVVQAQRDRLLAPILSLRRRSSESG